MAYNTFPRKGYGRIFVEKEEDIDAVKRIIFDMDEFEYDYLPDNFIAVFEPKYESFPSDSPKNHLFLKMVYTHKFDSLDLNELQLRCWAKGIKVFCVSSSVEEYEYYEV